MRFKIYTMEKVKEKFVLEGELNYLKRMSNTKVDLCELKGGSDSNLLAKIKPSEFLVVLDEKGKQFSSMEFSDFLSKTFSSGISNISFAIGAAEGWEGSAVKRANLVLSLSQFTFPHQMVRLILIEQLYRALSIMNNGPYHKA